MKIDKPAKRRPAVRTLKMIKRLKQIMCVVRWIGILCALIDKHWPKLLENLRELF